MSAIPSNYLEKVYSGILGKIIGVRLGAPVEPTIWTYEKIEATYGDIDSYIKEYKNFAADDDINGPVFFIRALIDYAKDRELEAQDVGKAWLNYTRESKGMFWWGGYGISTENTAYLNLKSGIEAPKSGSAQLNGMVLAEQIGGQIFIDSWGLVWPSNIDKAAEYAGKAASVSHDKNGIYGGRFIAACISKAFETDDVRKIVDAGLSVIPDNCEYARVTKAVINFYEKNPKDFRKCRDYLTANWGYDRYPGVCHIIPNAGVCILSLLYGKGDFSSTIEIATMCGWDTDCNAGNVGTILGVAQGLGGIKGKYRRPVNDMVVASSISGYLNVIDIPTFAKTIAALGYGLSKEEIPGYLLESGKEGEIFFDFNLPGSTHGFRSSNENLFSISHTNEISYSGSGALQILFDRVYRGKSGKIFYKPYYRRDDFDDERYSPGFSPLVYPGQKVSMKLYLDKWNGDDIGIATYVRDTVTKEDLKAGYQILQNNKWNDIEFEIPDTNGHMIDEVGIVIESFTRQKNKNLGRIIIDKFRVEGKGIYSIDFKNECIEFGCVTPFVHNRGAWTIEGGIMQGMSIDSAEAYTGNYYAKDVHIVANINPQFGFSHNLAFRVKGTMMGYHIGFDGENRVSLIKNDHGLKRLLTVKYNWEINKNYEFELIAKGNRFIFKINDEDVIEYIDNDKYFEYGMFGFSKYDMGRTHYGKIFVEEF
ncbi:ADP-ribosylglycohydrolase family protein [Wukongibacter baidiensis]|uniref:ADP-ribosylglycohydrolase family protein n=1 Tax=Wukongibacter baidiensis TaxID=1723361 RepID=UPI003D7F910C